MYSFTFNVLPFHSTRTRSSQQQPAREEPAGPGPKRDVAGQPAAAEQLGHSRCDHNQQPFWQPTTTHSSACHEPVWREPGIGGCSRLAVRDPLLEQERPPAGGGDARARAFAVQRAVCAGWCVLVCLCWFPSFVRRDAGGAGVFAAQHAICEGLYVLLPFTVEAMLAGARAVAVRRAV